MNYERMYWKLRQKIEELETTFNSDVLVGEQSGVDDDRARDRLMVIKMIKKAGGF